MLAPFDLTVARFSNQVAPRGFALTSPTCAKKGRNIVGKLWFAALVVLGMGAFGSGAMAQQVPNCLGRPDFDACTQSFIGHQMAANQQAQQQMFQAYLNEFGPMLRRQYPAYAHIMPFEQFAYQMMMSANGTNMEGANDARKNWFDGAVAANNTVKEGYYNYNSGSYVNSHRATAAVEARDRGAIRGTTLQINPATGRPVELPYSSQAYNQPFNQGGQSYMLTRQGYAIWNGNGWVLMQSAR